MPAAFLPGPSRGLWHLGPVPLRAYAACIILGIVVGLWLTCRRYAKVGGRAGLILDIAAIAVPAGFAGARLYSMLTDYHAFAGNGGDWAGILRIWDSGLGLPGAVAGGGLGAWIACRRRAVPLAPVAWAVAPALALGQAIGVCGNWFSQHLYGRPTMLAWAQRISPGHRISGYQNFATFQPVFLYEAIWDVLAGLAVIYCGRRLWLAGGRLLAVSAGLLAVGRLGAELLRIDVRGGGPSGPRADQVVMVLALVGVAVFLYLTRGRRRPDAAAPAAVQAGVARRYHRVLAVSWTTRAHR